MILSLNLGLISSCNTKPSTQILSKYEQANYYVAFNIDNYDLATDSDIQLLVENAIVLFELDSLDSSLLFTEYNL